MAEFDFAVIGAGAAGLSVANVAARLGQRVALIERGCMGGDCLNSGCVPSKALLAAGHAAEAARQAGRYGVRLPEPAIDWPAVSAHVARAIATIAPADSEERYRGLGVTVLRETARFVAPDTLAVGGRRITARRIVIAAGSHPAVPDIPGLAETPYLTNETLFGLPAPPGHLLILGGGAIGIEMAQAHRLLGCRVTVVEAGAILAREDTELAAGLRAVLAGQGIRFIEHARVLRAGPGATLTVAGEAGAGEEHIEGTHLLLAAGRHPALDDLGLEAGNVRATPHGIATDRGLRSLSNRRVYAVGDVADPEGVGPRAFTHAGSYHAGLVIRRAVFRVPARLDYAAFPRVIYTAPELAQVGLTAAEAEKASGGTVEVHRWNLAENDRAIAEADPTGFAKLVIRRGRLIGAGMLGANAGEMAGAWGLAIARRLPMSALAGLTLPYPTRAEAAKRAAGLHYEPSLFGVRTRFLARLLARFP